MEVDDSKDADKEQSKMSEDEAGLDDVDAKMDSKSTASAKDARASRDDDGDDNEVIGLICLTMLSVPYYTQRLTQYKLDTVIKSLVSDSIWHDIISQFEGYCIDLYHSYVYATSTRKKKSKYNNMWQTIIPSALRVSKLVSYADDARNVRKDESIDVEMNEEQKASNNHNEDVMDMPDFDDFDEYSDDDEDDAQTNRNTLQTFMNITEEQQQPIENALNVEPNEKKEDVNSSELYMSPNTKNPSLRRKKKRKNRRGRKGNKKSGDVINELPAIV